jgi:hypothetical protein
MIIRIKLDALKQGRWWEYLIRFSLGGLATVLVGIVAHFCGPSFGGLFLAFPAVFCASATLVERHERQRKEQKGMKGRCRGRGAAALDASGAALASFGMVAFGLCVWLFASNPTLAMCLATGVWAAVSYVLWRLFRH